MTDSGEKKSAKGRIVIRQSEGGLQMIDGLTIEQQAAYDHDNLLRLVWRNGDFVKRQTLAEIRARVQR